MTVRAFLDTSVLVYLFDDADPDKQQRARVLLGDPGYHFVLSTQVLGEFYVVVTRKLRRPLDTAGAAAAIQQLTDFFVVGTDAALVLAAVRTAELSQLSYWDSLIIEAAASADCEVLLTEDLSDGAVIRGVRVQNPFISER